MSRETFFVVWSKASHNMNILHVDVWRDCFYAMNARPVFLNCFLHVLHNLLFISLYSVLYIYRVLHDSHTYTVTCVEAPVSATICIILIHSLHTGSSDKVHRTTNAKFPENIWFTLVEKQEFVIWERVHNFDEQRLKDFPYGVFLFQAMNLPTQAVSIASQYWLQNICL